MRQSGFALPDMVPLFTALLALPLPDSYPPLALTPERQKEKIPEALLVWLLREAERQRVLLIIEDLHWLDAPTLEFLNLLADQAAITHLFMTKGLEVLKTLPETPERRHQELTLQLALGAALSITEQAYSSARQLCQQVGDSPQRFAALAGLLRFIAAARGSRRHRNWGNSS